MARDISAPLQTHLDGQPWRFTTLVEISLGRMGVFSDPSESVGATLFITDREGVTVDGIGYTRRLLDSGSLTQDASIDPQQAVSVGDITITVDNSPTLDEDTGTYRSWLTRHARRQWDPLPDSTIPRNGIIEGQEIKIWWTATTTAGATISKGDAYSFFEGVVTHVGPYSPETCIVKAQDISEYYGNIPMLKVLTRDDIPTLPSRVEAKVLPAAFGNAPLVPLTPLDVGYELELVDDMGFTTDPRGGTDPDTILVTGDDLDLVAEGDGILIDNELMGITNSTASGGYLELTVTRHALFITDAFGPGKSNPPGWPTSATLKRPHRAGASVVKVGDHDSGTNEITPMEYVYGIVGHPMHARVSASNPIQGLRMKSGNGFIRIEETSEIDDVTEQWEYREYDNRRVGGFTTPHRFAIYNGGEVPFFPPTISLKYRKLKIRGPAIEEEHDHGGSGTIAQADLAAELDDDIAFGAPSVDDTTTLLYYSGGTGTIGAGNANDDNFRTFIDIIGNLAGKGTLTRTEADLGTIQAAKIWVNMETLVVAASTITVSFNGSWNNAVLTCPIQAAAGIGFTVGATLTGTPDWDFDISDIVFSAAAPQKVTLYEVWVEVDYTPATAQGLKSGGVTVDGDVSASVTVNPRKNITATSLIPGVIANEFTEVSITDDLYVDLDYGTYDHYGDPATHYPGAPSRFTWMPHMSTGSDISVPAQLVVYCAHWFAGVPLNPGDVTRKNRINEESFTRAINKQWDAITEHYKFASVLTEQMTLKEFMRRAAWQSRTNYFWTGGQLHASFGEKPGKLQSVLSTARQLTEADEAGGRIEVDHLPQEYLTTEARPYFGLDTTVEKQGLYRPIHRQAQFQRGRTWVGREMKEILGTVSPDDDRFQYDMIRETSTSMTDDVTRYHISHFGGIKKIIRFPADARLLSVERFDLVTLRYQRLLPGGPQVWYIFDDLDGTRENALFMVRNIVQTPGSAKVDLILFEIKRTNVVRFNPTTEVWDSYDE